MSDSSYPTKIVEKLETEFYPFFTGMIEELLHHYPENGDSWMTCDIDWLVQLTESAMLRFFDDTDNGILDNPSHLLDIANFCAFLYLRCCPTSPTSTTEDVKP